ncbi:dTMP kinase [Croceicoccus estronivorus]|uniref:dTMP kinase n=1 Tax=Croceicoccus estronivorus TaxID=1172626 RepID=UPI00082F9654|nr:dTMP kinase [Croceicoccus estronivorus]OCC24528.1 dTMP kinase [Croceicoccus estronivorus]
MMRGRFITFEGGEGVGKSTQARMLATALEALGLEVTLTREPGGTPGAEAIRKLLLGVDGQDWGSSAEALLFAAARSDHVESLIRPALESGRWVVCDRFLDSSLAYQGGGNGIDSADLLELHRIGTGGLLPDRTVLVEVSPEITQSRLIARDNGTTDRIGGRDAAYHARVAAAFARLASAAPARFVRIDGQGAPESVHAEIFSAIAPLVEQRG